MSQWNPSYPVGSIVRHVNRPDINAWVVICSMLGRHLLRTVPDENGDYEVIRGDGRNLVLILGMDSNETKEGKMNTMIWNKTS